MIILIINELRLSELFEFYVTFTTFNFFMNSPASQVFELRFVGSNVCIDFIPPISRESALSIGQVSGVFTEVQMVASESETIIGVNLGPVAIEVIKTVFDAGKAEFRDRTFEVRIRAL